MRPHRLLDRGSRRARPAPRLPVAAGPCGSRSPSPLRGLFLCLPFWPLAGATVGVAGALPLGRPWGLQARCRWGPAIIAGECKRLDKVLFFYNSLNLVQFVPPSGRSVTRANPSANSKSPVRTYIYISISISHIYTYTRTLGRFLSFFFLPAFIRAIFVGKYRPSTRQTALNKGLPASVLDATLAEFSRSRTNCDKYPPKTRCSLPKMQPNPPPAPVPLPHFP